jgi:hypothetical protein
MVSVVSSTNARESHSLDCTTVPVFEIWIILPDAWFIQSVLLLSRREGLARLIGHARHRIQVLFCCLKTAYESPQLTKIVTGAGVWISIPNVYLPCRRRRGCVRWCTPPPALFRRPSRFHDGLRVPLFGSAQFASANCLSIRRGDPQRGNLSGRACSSSRIRLCNNFWSCYLSTSQDHCPF